jgi:signal transduction histidine kinase/CheY-like chemotaxis protein
MAESAVVARPGPSQQRRAAHDVQFYESDEVLAATVSQYLAEGLVAGEPAVAILTPDHADALLRELGERGLDVARARAAGTLAVLDAEETLGRFMVDDEPDWQRFHDEIGGTIARCAGPAKGARVRAYGEMVDVLWRQGQKPAALRLEEMWNRLQQDGSFSLLCAYMLGNFHRSSDAADFGHVCDLHHHVLPAPGPVDGADASAQRREISRLQQRALALETELLRRSELEEALRGAREQAERANRTKDEFLAMLGHELRNPLAPILTALELMKLRSGGSASREQEVIDRQARHLVRLVDDLLDVSRITRGLLQLRRERVDLRDVLAKATEMASPLLESRRHHLDVRAPERGALMVQGDEARLAQVVANLLTNAARYTPAGGHVVVEAHRAGEEAVIEVRDDGDGIPADLLSRVFDLFVQGPQEVDRGNGGLGIGLALVRSLVGMHGGRVSAHSDGPGKGSLFRVHLPAQAADSAAPRADAPRAKKAGRSRRILLVDDNGDALEMLTELLRGAGHEVRSVSDGPAALEAVADFRPELAILDIGLPAMDGYDLAARLRERMGAETPVLVALTGYGQEADRRRSESAGFALHLVKPVEAREILATIEGGLN